MTDIRYLFMAMPPKEVRQALLAFLERHGLNAPLGSTMFAVENWHQSLSNRFWDPTPAVIDALQRAGALVQAHAVPLLFNRMTGSKAPQIHWTLRAKGKPAAFTELLVAVGDALAAAGLPRGSEHQAHITVSYRAPSALETLRLHPPVRWLVDELLLVRGGPENGTYLYEVRDRWKLKAPPQLTLF